MRYIANAFSPGMVPSGDHSLQIIDLTEARWRTLAEGAKSIIGHPDTARVLGFPYNRESVKIDRGDHLLVAQLQGGRLPEGATTLPEGFTFRYMLVILR